MVYYKNEKIQELSLLQKVPIVRVHLDECDERVYFVVSCGCTCSLRPPCDCIFGQDLGCVP